MKIVALYYRQLSADILMKTYKIKTSFVSPEGPKVRANKSGITFFFNFNISRKLLACNSMV